jgi:hypothetical protein
MSNHIYISEEVAAAAVAAVEAHGSKAAAARALGVPRETLRYRLGAAYANYGMQPGLPTIPVPEGQRIGKCTVTVAPDGSVSTRWARMDKSAAAVEEWVASLIDSVEGKRPQVLPPKVKKLSNDILQVVIGDPHAGMYAWAKETGSDYDLDIFKRIHLGSICNLIDRAGAVGEIILTWLGDLMHSDHRNGTTQSGNILDMDGRMGAIMDAVQWVVNSAIEYAAKSAPKVTVVFVSGNHDPVSTKWMQRLTAAYWRNSAHIEVPIFEANRYYLQRGKCLLMAHHGDKIPATRLALLCAQEQAKMWADTQYRVCDCGHIHHAKKLAPSWDIEECPGLTVEYHRVMAGLEAYGAEAGYSASRAMSARLLSLEHGETGRLIVTPGMIK